MNVTFYPIHAMELKSYNDNERRFGYYTIYN